MRLPLPAVLVAALLIASPGSARKDVPPTPAPTPEQAQAPAADQDEAPAADLDPPEANPGPIAKAKPVRAPRMPANQRAALSMARTAFQLKDLEAQVAADAPATDNLARGHSLARAKNDRAAALEFVLAIEKDRALAAAWNNLGALLRRAGEWSTAKDCFETVLALNPDNGLAHFNMGTVYEHEKERDKADRSYIQALRLQPGLWSPSVNPLIIGSARSDIALHGYFMAERAKGYLVLDASH